MARTMASAACCAPCHAAVRREPLPPTYVAAHTTHKADDRARAAAPYVRNTIKRTPKSDRNTKRIRRNEIRSRRLMPAAAHQCFPGALHSPRRRLHLQNEPRHSITKKLCEERRACRTRQSIGRRSDARTNQRTKPNGGHGVQTNGTYLVGVRRRLVRHRAAGCARTPSLAAGAP